MRLFLIISFFLSLITGISFCPLASAKKAKSYEPKKRSATSRPNAKSNIKEKARKPLISNDNVKKKTHMSADEKRVFEFQKKCKSAVPNNFSPSQVDEFCTGITNKESISCAKDSRSGSVKLSFEETISLCKGSYD
jgi:hypothetical protein